jgi:hypothetical protein
MSDLKVENMGLLEKYPDVQFYDYTKNPIRMKKFINKEFPKNYHLTFSLGSSNKEQAKQVLKAGGNVAVVFRNKKLPKTFWGHKVFNADKTDLRFKDPLNVIMGLYAKGKARKTKRGLCKMFKYCINIYGRSAIGRSLKLT